MMRLGHYFASVLFILFIGCASPEVQIPETVLTPEQMMPIMPVVRVANADEGIDLAVAAEHDVRGQRGAYLVHARLSLAAGEQRTWSIVGDVEQDAADVVELRELLTLRRDTLEEDA